MKKKPKSKKKNQKKGGAVNTSSQSRVKFWKISTIQKLCIWRESEKLIELSLDMIVSGWTIIYNNILKTTHFYKNNSISVFFLGHHPLRRFCESKNRVFRNILESLSSLYFLLILQLVSLLHCKCLYTTRMESEDVVLALEHYLSLHIYVYHNLLLFIFVSFFQILLVRFHCPEYFCWAMMLVSTKFS